VSRLTVREALKVMAGRDLVEVRQGRPAVVTQPSARVIGDFFSNSLRREPSSLLEMLEVRQALEIHIATLAAKRRSRAALVGIELALDAMRAATDSQSFHDADMHFHEALAMATSNRMLSFLVEALEQPLRESFRQSIRGHELRGSSMEDVLAEHQAIFDRVRDQDPRGAGQAMRRHLATAELDLKASLRQPQSFDDTTAGSSPERDEESGGVRS
jgi:GntR family transcriptional repressor for pyruvate dehydrogenase complex